ncbi:MAG: hypothetical protein R3353_02525, partial [Salegentibacter mishustinae]|nr:hypothetical protein [Salegentibacter mishustinae]
YENENSPITYLVEKSLLSSSKVKSLTDSLSNTAEVRFLETDLPEYQPEIVKDTLSESPNYWKLAKEMENLKTDSVVVFTNAFVSGIKGKRPEISKNIHWINLNPGTAKTNLVGAVKRGNEIERISVISDAEEFKFQKEKQNLNTSEIESEFRNIPVVELDILQVQIYAEEEFQAEIKYIKASFLALEKYLEQPIEILNFKEKNFNSNSEEILIWLSEKPAPKTEGKVLVFRKDSLANSLIEQGNSKNEYYLTGELNSENIVEDYFAEQLLEILNLYPEINKEAVKYDVRMMDLALLKPTFGEASELPKNRDGRDISKYLWIILIILILSERALARVRKQ